MLPNHNHRIEANLRSGFAEMKTTIPKFEILVPESTKIFKNLVFRDFAILYLLICFQQAIVHFHIITYSCVTRQCLLDSFSGPTV